MTDTIREIEAVHREVGEGRIAAGVGRAVRLQRDYHAPIEDVWDAVTNPEQDQPVVPTADRGVPRRRSVPARGQRGGPRSSPANGRIG